MGAAADLPVGFSGFFLCSGQACGRGQEGPRVCSRKEATMLAAMVRTRPRAAGERPGAELLAGAGSSCCWSGSESWKRGFIFLQSVLSYCISALPTRFSLAVH